MYDFLILTEPPDGQRQGMIDAANRAYDLPLLNVTQKDITPPEGDLRDYMSMGPYWWPDPNKADGLPYVRRDGEVYPEARKGNAYAMEQMAERVYLLSFAWHWTRDKRYAEKAATQLRIWFLDDKVGMRPHLQYAQAVPGSATGRSFGIIESEALVLIPDLTQILLRSGAWTAEDQEGLKTWFKHLTAWLLCSPYGREEACAHNNHGMWYDAQVMVFAWFCDRADLAATLAKYSVPPRFKNHIAPDGSQPHELARTLSWNYSIFNLQAMLTAALVSKRIGVNLTDWKGDEGQDLQKAFQFLADHAPGKEKPWVWPQISPREKMDDRFQTFENLMQRAGKLFDTAKSVDGVYE